MSRHVLLANVILIEILCYQGNFIHWRFQLIDLRIFQLILQRLDLRRSAGNFGSLLLTTITKSQGKSILLDTGEATLPMKTGNDLKMSQFNFAPMPALNKDKLNALKTNSTRVFLGLPLEIIQVWAKNSEVNLGS